MAKRIVATLKQQNMIALVLFECCKTDEQGFAIYQDGWSDQMVVDEVNKRLPDELILVTPKAVETRRKEVYGNVRGALKADLEARIVMLESQVAHLTEQLKILAGPRFKPYVPPQGRPHSTPPE